MKFCLYPISAIQKMTAGFREACVDDRTPLGLPYQMAEGRHSGPQPDFVHPGRADWGSSYYHRTCSRQELLGIRK